jgi:hypothetical protein
MRHGEDGCATMILLALLCWAVLLGVLVVLLPWAT